MHGPKVAGKVRRARRWARKFADAPAIGGSLAANGRSTPRAAHPLRPAHQADQKAPDNVFTPGNVGEASDPAIANTAAESHRRSRAAADATQQERGAGFPKGPGTPDTSGRGEQAPAKRD